MATANVENLPSLDASPPYCKGDWEDLPFFFGSQTFPPDILLVQQIDSSTQLDAFLNALNEQTGEDYEAVIANELPENWGAAECDYKKVQTNGIAYRKARFQLLPGSTLPISAFEPTPDGGCIPSNADRYRGVSAEFSDSYAGGLRAAVASVRWPSGGGCEMENLAHVRESLSVYSDANVHVWGGDLGVSDLEFQDEEAPLHRGTRRPTMPSEGMEGWLSRRDLSPLRANRGSRGIESQLSDLQLDPVCNGI